MIKFRDLPDDHPDLGDSPLLGAAHLTLNYAIANGPIALTKGKAFKRNFVDWAADNFCWPGWSKRDLMRYNKVINETDFPPLELLHFLLTELKLGRHYKDVFRLTQLGRQLSTSKSALFHKLIPFYILNIDHASYGRLDLRPFGNWDVWMNVINVEVDPGTTEHELYGAFYKDGPNWDNAGWREMAAFSHFVLQPLEWSGLLARQETKERNRSVSVYFKTPLWRAALVLDTDHLLKPVIHY